MSRYEALSMREIEEIINDPSFMASFGDDCDVNETIDIVELPPDRVDEMSDCEDIDDNIIETIAPFDVPGSLEIHANVENENEEHSGQRKKKVKAIVNSNWTTEDATYSKTYPDTAEIEQRKSNLVAALKGKSAVECFEEFFDEEVLNLIVRESVRYATQNNNHSYELSNECIKNFIGILLFTGYHALPQEKLYWNEDEDFDIRCVRQCMSRNRYLEIKRHLHFNDNSRLNRIPLAERDKLFKIRPLIDLLNNNFKKFQVFSHSLSIDEQMVRYYGHHYLKQFIRGKPVRFGFKQWAMCCSQSGFCYHMSIYEGKSRDTNDVSVLGLSGSVVLNMTSFLRTPELHKIYFDNFFTSFRLMKELSEMRVRATGTARLNRMNNCPLESENSMKKKQRGAYDYRFDKNTEIMAVMWKDNNCVKLLSNHETVHPVRQVKRWSKAENKEVQVPQPRLISEYKSYGRCGQIGLECSEISC